MSKLRVIFQTNVESDLDTIKSATAQARTVEGCLQAEDFRSVEFDENLLHLQLWESMTAWQDYWQRLTHSADGQRLIRMWNATTTPNHHGYRNRPRRTGQNGIEFYKHAPFALADGVWAQTDPAERAESIRWPTWSAVRIVIQTTEEPGPAPQSLLEETAATRSEPGCVHYETFRGVEFEENKVLVETWATPDLYDLHWMQRLIQARAREASGSTRPHPAPKHRRYGRNGFEWYPLCYYSLIEGVWMPERPELRMVTVHW